MKLQSVKKGFLIHNTKRGARLVVKPGDIFELDENVQEEKDQILQLLHDGRAFVADEALLPLNGKYVVKRGYSETRPDASLFILTATQVVSLDQKDASRLLMAGIVAREDDRDWSPGFLKGIVPIRGASPKKMFDDDVEPSVFVNKGFRRERG